jgi:hypothetical protein
MLERDRGAGESERLQKLATLYHGELHSTPKPLRLSQLPTPNAVNARWELVRASESWELGVDIAERLVVTREAVNSAPAPDDNRHTIPSSDR